MALPFTVSATGSPFAIECVSKPFSVPATGSCALVDTSAPFAVMPKHRSRYDAPNWWDPDARKALGVSAQRAPVGMLTKERFTKAHRA